MPRASFEAVGLPLGLGGTTAGGQLGDLLGAEVGNRGDGLAGGGVLDGDAVGLLDDSLRRLLELLRFLLDRGHQTLPLLVHPV